MFTKYFAAIFFLAFALRGVAHAAPETNAPHEIFARLKVDHNYFAIKGITEPKYYYEVWFTHFEPTHCAIEVKDAMELENLRRWEMRCKHGATAIVPRDMPASAPGKRPTDEQVKASIHSSNPYSGQHDIHVLYLGRFRTVAVTETIPTSVGADPTERSSLNALVDYLLDEELSVIKPSGRASEFQTALCSDYAPALCATLPNFVDIEVPAARQGQLTLAVDPSRRADAATIAAVEAKLLHSAKELLRKTYRNPIEAILERHNAR